MRESFIRELETLAERDERIYLLTADLGWSVLERFSERFPHRFLNVGVAEQNMVGIATGLAQLGYIPFVYSIATFASMRCYEQIRNGPILHHLPVRIVGIGGGYSYGHAGPTHYALEDLAITRAQPGLLAIAPADPEQCRNALRSTFEHPSPIYFRVGKGNNPEIPGLDGRFELGRPELVRKGEDLLYLATGTVSYETVNAANRLESVGISAAVAVMAHLPSSPTEEICDLLWKYSSVITVEEAYTTGGLGSLVAESIATRGLDCRLRIQGILPSPSGISGSREYMNRRFGLDCDSLYHLGCSLNARKKAA